MSDRMQQCSLQAHVLGDQRHISRAMQLSVPLWLRVHHHHHGGVTCVGIGHIWPTPLHWGLQLMWRVPSSPQLPSRLYEVYGFT